MRRKVMEDRRRDSVMVAEWRPSVNPMVKMYLNDENNEHRFWW